MMMRTSSLTGPPSGGPLVEQDASIQEVLQSLQSASQAWAAFDWNGKKNQLDKAALAAKEQKEQSLAARKLLGDTTKQFKKSVKSMEQASTSLKQTEESNEASSAAVKAMEGLAKECRHTIKSYQEEIDNLTRRCKGSEGAFSVIHSAMAEVPDPLSLIAVATEQIRRQQTQISQLLRTVDEVNKEMTVMEANAAHKKETPSSSLSREEKEELLQLRREVAEYEVEFRSLKNQDITIRKLEAKIAELEDGAQESLVKELEKAKAELAETEGRRAAEALEREAAMERRAETLELQLKAERAGREATQTHLLEADEGAGEREAAWEAQRKILVDDAERLRESLHETARERDELRLRVAALQGTDNDKPASPPSGGVAMADVLLERKAFEAEVSELSHTVNSLREEIRLKDEAAHDERRTLQASLDRSERERASLTTRLEAVEVQLASAPSQKYVDSIKRELRILKRLEYNAEDTERDPEMTGGNEEEEQDFEAVLVTKLKRVESELVRERNNKVDASRECDQLKRALAESEKAKADAEKIIASLEKDLERALNVSATSPALSSKKSISTQSSRAEDPAMLQNILEPGTPAQASPTTPVATPSASSAAERANDDHSVATIVMAQRDRLRARCDALEAERDSFKRELQAQVQATESLKVDNTKLYEKVRYLQTYQNRKGLQDRDLDLEALEQRYEASVDPFRQFSRAERQRKMKEMSPMERIVFVVAKTVLGTKEMRTALFFYVCAMHLLVFFTTYHGSHGECDDTTHHDILAHLPPDQHARIAEAAAAAAAENGG
jgi:homeobox protein cut-like